MYRLSWSGPSSAYPSRAGGLELVLGLIEVVNYQLVVYLHLDGPAGLVYALDNAHVAVIDPLALGTANRPGRSFR